MTPVPPARLDPGRISIVSMELFDATPREFSVLDYLFNPNSTRPVSSFDTSPLEVASLAFWSRTPSRFLSVTATGQGITSRQLLMGTLTDQVWMGIRCGWALTSCHGGG